MASRRRSSERAHFKEFAERSVFLGKEWIQDYCESCGNFSLLKYHYGLYLCSSCRPPQRPYKRSSIKHKASKRSTPINATTAHPVRPEDEYWELNTKTGRWTKKTRTLEHTPMPLTELRKILKKSQRIGS